MAMPCSLPDDLLRDILEQYLCINVIGLSKLDVAFCNHILRNQMMAVLRTVSVAESVQLDTILLKNRRLKQYMEWIVSRQFTVMELHVCPFQRSHPPCAFFVINGCCFYHTWHPFYNYDRRRTRIPRKLLDWNCYCVSLFRNITLIEVGFVLHIMPGITKLRFPFFKIGVVFYTGFEACFPNVTELDFSGWEYLLDDTLEQLGGIRSPLTVLKLGGCFYISSQVVSKVCRSHAHPLQELVCDVLRDQALNELTDHCHQLTSLQIACNWVGNAGSIEELCAANASCLKHLTLRYEEKYHTVGDVITNDMVANITSSCCYLQHICFGDSVTTITFDCLPVLLNNCPNMRKVQLLHAALRSCANDDRPLRGNQCHLDVSRYTVAPLLAGLLWQLPVQFTSLVSEPFIATVLVEACGSDLLMLELDSRFAIMNFLHILCCCPNLHTLKVPRYYETSASLLLLPVRCPALTVLNFSHTLLSTEELLAWLDSCRTNDIAIMTALEFPNAVNFTDEVLRRVAAQFPALRSLDIAGTPVTKETLVELMHSRALQLKELKCSCWTDKRQQLACFPTTRFL